MQLKNNHIKNLIKTGENVSVDFKQTISSASKIAKTMVSFANTVGGKLLVGVRDNGTISGVKSEDEKYMLDLAANFFCKPAINLIMEEFIIDGKIVIEAEIVEGQHKPYYAKDEEGNWWVHVRVNDKSLLASKTTVDFLKRKNSEENSTISFTKLEKNILEFISSREKTTINEVCKKFNIGKFRASKILVNLMSWDVVRSHTMEKEEFFTGV